ncbi:MAG: 4-(cytidine 5'-diphospho)-2-C-methyl-D-erythritol kinase [Lachnospiraceae bacterium]|nr:4-(cytidine 5'-diphospho)-2-C-methyl-D-erythritol kinase [Lachnospiraceae bacterium]
MNEYHVKAFAKINLGLDVINKMPNGYHQVKMIMQSIGLYDELTLQKTDSGITISTDSDLLPTDQNNLIRKAAEIMYDKHHITSGVHIHLKKNIPIAAGMAGGSTDAAAALKGIDILFGLNIPLSRLAEYAVSIGADVPYCLLGGTALAEGIGERLTPLPAIPDCYILVAKPDIMVSTKFVYEQLDARPFRHPDIDGMTEAIQTGNLSGILSRMENVLESVTIPAYPVIEDLKKQMLCLGAAASLMSGSGPTVFGIFPTKQAQAAHKALEHFQSSPLAKEVFLVRRADNQTPMDAVPTP